jgi:methyl-accepting chemotaxis protein
VLPVGHFALHFLLKSGARSMIRMSDLRITARLVIAIAVPLAFFTVLAGYDLFKTWRVRAEMTELGENTQGATKISLVVHQLQRERGISAIFLSSKGAQARAELPAQRQHTDEQREIALAFLASAEASASTDEFRNAIAAARTAVASLDGKRKVVDDLSFTPQDSFAYYTDTISKLLAVADALAKISSLGETSTAIAAYVSLLRAKEYAGQERAAGAAGLSQGKFDASRYARLLGFQAAQETYFNTFTAAATPAQQNFFAQAMSGTAIDAVAKMRDVIAAGGLTGELQGLSSQSWFDATTSRIDVLKTVEDRIAADLVALTNSIENGASRTLAVLAGIVAVAFAVGLVLAFLISRSISSPLLALVALLQKLAGGDYGVEIDGSNRKDEIGDVAKTAVVFKQNGLAKVRMEREQREAERQMAQEREKAAAAKAEMEQRQQEAEKRAAADREAAAAEMARTFEGAVGGIVHAAVDGDFSQRVAVDGKTELIRNVGGGINTLCKNIENALTDLAGMLTALAAGDLTRRINTEYRGHFATLKNSANETAEAINMTIAQIKQLAGEVSNAAAEISASTTDLSQRTEEQAAALEETSASMEQISATVKKNAESAQEANHFAAEMRSVAERGGVIVGEAVDAMARIEESSHKISDIIGVIDEIARQTNLLALNAAVEAARAGEAGRGFAVVASEVRSLAQRSSQAAKDIAELITNSSNEVKDGAAHVNRAGKSLTEIAASINKVAGIVSDIAAASAEQASGLEQVNKALSQMDEVTQQNSALVEENAATAKTLEAQAKTMDERVSIFLIEGDGAASREGRPPQRVNNGARAAARTAA